MTAEQIEAEVAKFAEYILRITRERGVFLVAGSKLGNVQTEYDRETKRYTLTVLGTPYKYSGLTKAEIKGDLCRDVIAVEVEA